MFVFFSLVNLYVITTYYESSTRENKFVDFKFTSLFWLLERCVIVQHWWGRSLPKSGVFIILKQRPEKWLFQNLCRQVNNKCYPLYSKECKWRSFLWPSTKRGPCLANIQKKSKKSHLTWSTNFHAFIRGMFVVYPDEIKTAEIFWLFQES